METEHKPATRSEIAEAMVPLFGGMPAKRGAKTGERLEAYQLALQGFPLDAIKAGITKFLSGECEDVKPDFCPLPPQLAVIIRGTPEGKAVAAKGEAKPVSRRLFTYKRPESKIILANCTKQFAWSQIEIGRFPRGSIWCPGGLTDRPEIGDLYGPDPTWRNAVPEDGNAPVEQSPASANEAQKKLMLDYDAFVNPFPPKDRRFPDE